MSWAQATQRAVDLAISLGSRAVIDSTLYSRGSSNTHTCPVCPACEATCSAPACAACPACSATCAACPAADLGVLIPWTLFALVVGICVGGLIGVRGGWTFRAHLFPHQILDVPGLYEAPEAATRGTVEAAFGEAPPLPPPSALPAAEPDSGHIQSAGARAAIAAAHRRRQLTA
jgi:hypothetical protein